MEGQGWAGRIDRAGINCIQPNEFHGMGPAAGGAPLCTAATLWGRCAPCAVRAATLTPAPARACPLPRGCVPRTFSVEGSACADATHAKRARSLRGAETDCSLLKLRSYRNRPDTQAGVCVCVLVLTPPSVGKGGTTARARDATSRTGRDANRKRLRCKGMTALEQFTRALHLSPNYAVWLLFLLLVVPLYRQLKAAGPRGVRWGIGSAATSGSEASLPLSCCTRVHQPRGIRGAHRKVRKRRSLIWSNTTLGLSSVSTSTCPFGAC